MTSTAKPRRNSYLDGYKKSIHKCDVGNCLRGINCPNVRSRDTRTIEDKNP